VREGREWRCPATLRRNTQTPQAIGSKSVINASPITSLEKIPATLNEKAGQRGKK
jgi:hypothetical protein